MKNFGKLLLLLVVVAGVASLSCRLTSQFLPSRSVSQLADFHRWVHTQLNLTEEQHKALDAQEERFAAQKKLFIETIAQANAELGSAMQVDREYSPRVVAAIEKIHRAQSDLEKATLMHIFAMKSVLTPEQFDKLLKLTSDALNTPADL